MEDWAEIIEMLMKCKIGMRLEMLMKWKIG